MQFSRRNVSSGTLSNNRFPKSGLALIGKLVGEKPAGLNENWAAAACYSSGMEIVVNKKMLGLGLKIEEKGFDIKFKELIRKTEESGIKVSELEKQLPCAFWKIRNEVIHAGYSPTQEELELITNRLKRIIDYLLPNQTKSKSCRPIHNKRILPLQKLCPSHAI